ncbi:MAG TPA: hypothetical protein VLA12_13635, partial [Planctomycetaceae bacterium]|nr:hypothetical protein [Planctomycetaceae bacterium]
MNRWLRKVHLSYGMLVFVAAIYVVMGYFPSALYRLFGGEGAYPDKWLGDIAALCLLTGCYGVYRAAAFHPLFRTQYREWLTRTPWSWGRQLLEGPVTLVWQDLFFVVIATAVTVLHRGQPLQLVPSIFLTCYLIVWLIALSITGQAKHAYAIALGLSGLLFVWMSTIGSMILFGALYLIARHGIGQCFRAFADWSPDPWRSCNPNLRALSSQQKQRDRRLGWPYDVLSPKRIEDSISVGWSAALGVLVGWWCFAAMFLYAPARSTEPLMLACLIAIIIGGIRLGVYLVGSAA